MVAQTSFISQADIQIAVAAITDYQRPHTARIVLNVQLNLLSSPIPSKVSESSASRGIST
jgi:hypothetical protein